MVDYNAPLFQNKPEVWDAKKCQKMVRHLEKDGLGTPYPWRGYIGQDYGDKRYNGGCIRNGEWYQGENKPLPIVADGYKIISIPGWGYRIVKDSSD